MTEILQMMRRKLRYRAWHMGTRELDLLCGQYADACLEMMDEQDLHDFTVMLKIDDRDLQDIFLSTEFPSSLPEKTQKHELMLKKIHGWHHGK
ncbi:MAG: succinate dehydrogenase assembly factor 2 [Alphaproteobacteria bacterium]|nr:succinate dehydrogenase assembly factor 2 [Alphaproteobacteria bacterium]